jgi:tetratricopeptide (TPR) repeat protein
VVAPLPVAERPPEPPPPLPPPEPKAEPPAEARPAEAKPAEATPAEATPAARPEPRPTSTRKLLAEAKRLREANRPEQALEIYGRIASNDPENVEALTGRGLCYFDLDQAAPAEASFQEALRLSPAQPDALLGLAESYRARGRKAEALRMFERYLAAHPAGDEAAVARNAINQLKE